jgi:hypothetical protein
VRHAEARGNAVGAQNPPDRAGRHPGSRGATARPGSVGSPPRILTSQPDDQQLYLIRDRRSALGCGRVVQRQACGCRLFGSHQATCAYSWISPPRRSRRTTLPGGAKTTGSPGSSGGAAPRRGAGGAGCNGWRTRPAPTAAADIRRSAPVQHLPPNGANPPLRIGVRPRRPRWSAPPAMPGWAGLSRLPAAGGRRRRLWFRPRHPATVRGRS